MALEKTLSESVIRRSIRKYFVDTYYTTLGIEVFFDIIERVPDITRWISVQVDSIDFDTMTTVYLQVFCFTRKDIDYVQLATLRDVVYEHLIDLTQTDGTKRIPLYDAAWTVDPMEWALLIPGNEFEAIELDDGTTVKIIPVSMRFGSK